MDPKHIRQFNTRSYQATVDDMRKRNEEVHAKGRKHLEQTGKVSSEVDIVGKPPRVSRNAMVAGDQPGTAVLVHGVSCPMLHKFDGTASTHQYVEHFFRAAERQNAMLDGVRTRYNPQTAAGVVNDVYYMDNLGIPVVQMTQFESDERNAQQIRLLVPGKVSNDTNAEDYDLGLYAPLYIKADFWEFYGLKGYLTLTLDEIGRGFVTASGVSQYLGINVDFSRMDTYDICEKLLDHWHLLILQVPSGYGDMLPKTTSWWGERVGPSRVVQVPDPGLLTEIRSAHVYVTEASHPSKQGLIEFLQGRGDGPDQVRVDLAAIEKVWRWINTYEEHFGAQARLPGYDQIPRPGDVFAHYRHAWPIGHDRAGENITPEEVAV